MSGWTPPSIKVRRNHRIVSPAVIVAVGVNSDGRHEVRGMTTGHSEAAPFRGWTSCAARPGGACVGVKLVISGAHEGLNAAIGKIFSATWQCCRVHFMRNALAYAGQTRKRVVSAWVGTAFAQDDAVTRLIDAQLFEQNDEWATQRGRYMTLETMAPLSDTPHVSLPEMAA